MNKLGRILLLVGVVVLALLVGLLIGRKQGVRQTAADAGNEQAVQITTAPPPTLGPPAPLPAPVQKPVAAAIPKLAPDIQVQEDAAAVGMTTQGAADQGGADVATTPASTPTTPAKTTAPAGDQSQDQPIG
jgi:hypothetical protein